MSPTLEELLEQFASSGNMPPELLGRIQEAMNDPSKIDEVLEALKGMGADQLMAPPLNMADFYREGTKPYRLLWPIATPLPMSFEQLDRKTQFFVLFQEWSRREMEGAMALNAGQIEEAKLIFGECLQRARQIEVGELIARTYEDMKRIAERTGDRDAARQFSQSAAQARAA